MRLRLTKGSKRPAGKRRVRLTKRKIRKKQPPNRVAGPSPLYDQGYEAGYSDALRQTADHKSDEVRAAFGEGYDKGRYEGGERLIETQLPEGHVLPEVGLEGVVAVGLEHMGHQFLRLTGAGEVFERMVEAMDAQRPLAVVRLGDGETLALAQELVMSAEEVRRAGPFLAYAGVDVPDIRARDMLADAVRRAGIVGIPISRQPYFQPLLFAVLRAHGIDYRELTLTFSTVNYMMYLEGYLSRLLAGRRVLLVGNAAEELAAVLERHGVAVAGAVAPVRGIDDVPAVMERIRGASFDIALVAAGIPAVVLAVRIADELGKVALDFGHLANSFVKGEAVWT